MGQAGSEDARRASQVRLTGLQVLRPPLAARQEAMTMTAFTLSSAQRILLTRVSDAAPADLEIAPRARASAAILAGHGLLEGAGDLWRITPAGRQALGLPEEPADAPTSTAPAGSSRLPREGTKAAQVVALLQRPEGATVVHLSEATGWLPHSVRGFLAGALKKTHGLTAVSEPADGGRIYRLPAGAGE